MTRDELRDHVVDMVEATMEKRDVTWLKRLRNVDGIARAESNRFALITLSPNVPFWIFHLRSASFDELKRNEKLVIETIRETANHYYNLIGEL